MRKTPTVFEEKIEKEDVSIYAFVVEISNALIVLLTDREYRTGTIAIAVPIRVSDRGPVSSSTLTVFGTKYEFLTRALAERVAHNSQKMTFLSLNFSGNKENLAPVAFEVINKILQKISKPDKS